MTTKLKLTFLSILGSIGIHAYLTWHYYPLRFGFAKKSACNINDTFNCDAVSASVYSSFFEIPLALWGAATQFVLLIVLITYVFGLSSHPPRMLRISFWLSLLIAAASVIMGSIALTMMNTYCLFCIAAYGLSFLTLILLHGSQNESPWTHLRADLKLGLTYIVLIPVISFLTHKSIINHYEADDFPQLIQSSLIDWEHSTKYDFSTPPILAQGPERSKAKMILAEFADFRCGHCKITAPNLKLFSQANPDVRLEFYVFPLDGECNDTISFKSGLSCHLSKVVYCAEKEKQLGWLAHDVIFENQETLSQSGSRSDLDKKITPLLEGQIDLKQLKTCIDSENTHEAIVAQGELGQKVGVQGTPTIYVNGKSLLRGQMIPVLNAVKKKIQ